MSSYDGKYITTLDIVTFSKIKYILIMKIQSLSFIWLGSVPYLKLMCASMIQSFMRRKSASHHVTRVVRVFYVTLLFESLSLVVDCYLIFSLSYLYV